MVTFQYRAVSPSGAKVRGVVRAVDEFAAVAQIKENYPIVQSIEPVEEKKNVLTMDIGPKKISPKALSVMCSQFAIILKSGVPITTCMDMIGDQTDDKLLKKMLKNAATDVEQGSGIASALERNCKQLPQTFVETVRAGEESGTLENSFKTLEKYYETVYKINQKVKKALAYPKFVLVIAFLVLLVVFIWVIPMLTDTFADLGGELPGITRFLIAISDLLRSHIIKILLLVVAAVIAFKVWSNTEKGRVAWNKFKLKIPILGNISMLNACSQFANTMSALMTAGMPVTRALDITSRVLDNYYLGTETARMLGSLEEGRRLGECMRASKAFPRTLVEMCAIGEETGEIEETLSTTGSYYDNEATHATEQAMAKLEPALLVVLAGFAGFIVMAIYLPIFTTYTLM